MSFWLSAQDVLAGFADIQARLRRIENQLAYLIKQGSTEMADLSRLAADVSAQKSVVASVKTMLDGLVAQITDLKNHTEDPAIQQALDDLATQIEDNTSALSGAVTANTPAAAAPA